MGELLLGGAYPRGEVALSKCHTAWSEHVRLAVTVADLWFSSIPLWADHKVPILFSCSAAVTQVAVGLRSSRIYQH